MGMEMAQCLSKCQNGNMDALHSGLEPQGESGIQLRTQKHTLAHTYTVRSRQSMLSQTPSAIERVSERATERRKTGRQQKRLVKRLIMGLERAIETKKRVHSCVCVLALTHSCSVHITSVHMGNNEITKISLLENQIRCIFMAGALCMLTA